MRWAGVKVGCADTFRRDRLAVGAGTENQVANLEAENRLLLLLGIQCVDELERTIVLVAERPDELSVHAVACRLRAGVRGRQHTLAPGQRHVDGEVMTAELHHPRLGGRRLAQNADVVLGAAEPDRRARLSSRGAAHLEILDRHRRWPSPSGTRRDSTSLATSASAAFSCAGVMSPSLRPFRSVAPTCIVMPEGRFDQTTRVFSLKSRFAFRRWASSSVARNASAAATARVVVSAGGAVAAEPPTRRLRRRRARPRRGLSMADGMADSFGKRWRLCYSILAHIH